MEIATYEQLEEKYKGLSALQHRAFMQGDHATAERLWKEIGDFKKQEYASAIELQKATRQIQQIFQKYHDMRSYKTDDLTNAVLTVLEVEKEKKKTK